MTYGRLIGVGVLAVSGTAWAQLALPPQVDPAALQRQELERASRQLQPPEPAEAQPAVIRREPATPTLSPMAPGVKFVLQEIKFSPSAFLAVEELQSVAKRFVGREVDFSSLTEIVAAVNTLYQQKGVLTASAILPQQRIRNGVVTIDLLEAKLGQVELLGNSYTRPDYVSSWFSDDLGKPLDAKTLEDRLKRFNRSSDVQLAANLRASASFGLTDVMLDVREPARFQFRAFTNTEGPQSVGREQVGVDLAMNGPAGIGDKISLYASLSRGATSGVLSYSVPFSHWGGRLSASLNQGSTEVVAGSYAALDITGRSRSGQLAVVQPVWQHGNWWFDLAASLGRTQSRNEISGLPLSNSTILNQTLGGTFSGATDQRSLSIGFTATHATASAENVADRAFNIYQLTGTWVENFGSSYFGLMRGATQATSDRTLSPSLLFQVGGVASVRGYAVGALSGDSGYSLNLELHRRVTGDVGAFAFVDSGGVKTSGLPLRSIRSFGAGLDLQWNKSVAVNITAGRAMKEVQPDQSKWLVTARASYAF